MEHDATIQHKAARVAQEVGSEEIENTVDCATLLRHSPSVQTHPVKKAGGRTGGRMHLVETQG